MQADRMNRPGGSGLRRQAQRDAALELLLFQNLMPRTCQFSGDAKILPSHFGFAQTDGLK